METFDLIPISVGRCQAITDVIQSIALEQSALASILTAEGDKLKKADSRRTRQSPSP